MGEKINEVKFIDCDYTGTITLQKVGDRINSFLGNYTVHLRELSYDELCDKTFDLYEDLIKALKNDPKYKGMKVDRED